MRHVDHFCRREARAETFSEVPVRSICRTGTGVGVDGECRLSLIRVRTTRGGDRGLVLDVVHDRELQASRLGRVRRLTAGIAVAEQSRGLLRKTLSPMDRS